MRYIIISILIISGTLQSSAQGPIGSWEDHLPYQNVKLIVAGNDEIYGATDYAISVYNKTYKEVRKLSRVHGLSECGISTIGYSTTAQTLVIAFNSTNIDLYRNGIITNIPDILNKYVAGRKEILRIRSFDGISYLLTTFGIVLLDIDNVEIVDTWNPSLSGGSVEVYDMAILDNQVFAATSDGLMQADINSPALAYFGNWDPVPGFSGSRIITDLATIENSLFLNRRATGAEGDSLLVFSEGSLATISSGPGSVIHSLESEGNSLVVAMGSEIEIYNQSGVLDRDINDYGWGIPNCRNAIIDGTDTYYADSEYGIVMESSSGLFTSVVIPGPYTNSASNIYSAYGQVYISGGIVDNAWNNTWTNFRSLLYEDRKWWSGIYYDSWDVMRIRPFPNNSNRIVVSTWGSGIYEIENHEIVEHYNDGNSPLETIIPGANYVRTCGLAFDNNANLWLTHSGVENSIKVLKPDKSWVVLPYTIDAPTIGDIIISRSDKKWIVLPRGHGLFVLDDNRSPENFNDDVWKKLTVKDQDGKTLNNIYSISEDLDGNIWIGTDQGPAVFYNPDRVFDENINCYRIKIPRDDGSGLADYLLGTETINTISIDGGNRKWFGTNSSGLFHVSEDGKEEINSYNVDNSPLLSNSITSVDIDDTTGEVWIGTDIGIITLRSGATEGDDGFDKVYAFPNPVRPEFKGSVTVTGLARDSSVKISDISGNLVFETTSTGGQAQWDLSTYNGERVSTGVYLAFCSSQDGSTSRVIKILVIK